MRVHFPELYDAHSHRSIEFLTSMAIGYSLTYEQFAASNWDTTGKETLMADIEIDDSVQMPADAATKPPTRRGRPKGSITKPSQGANLLTALEHISFVKSEAYEFSHFVALSNNCAVAYNNIMAAGHPIQEELTRSVHLDKLKAALNKCGKTLTITESANGLTVKGDKLRAIVPVMADYLAPMRPDDCIYSGDFDILKEAFRVAGTVTKETGEKPWEASLLLEPNQVTAWSYSTTTRHRYT
jgi:hypothetical protein